MRDDLEDNVVKVDRKTAHTARQRHPKARHSGSDAEENHKSHRFQRGEDRLLYLRHEAILWRVDHPSDRLSPPFEEPADLRERL